MEDEFKKFYEELWNLDQRNNGFSVSGKDKNGQWQDKDAGILLNEQNEAEGEGDDIAPIPLFYKVDETKFKRENYDSFLKLLNNYIVSPKFYEDNIGNNSEEDSERETFLENIMKTRVIERALEFINDTVKQEVIEEIHKFIEAPINSKLTMEKFVKFIEKVWFDIFIDYNGKTRQYCSAFEHVFVGEGCIKSDGEISGYHNWIKFYQDEKGKKVEFEGYNYDRHGRNSDLENQGMYNPYIVSVQMTWKVKDSSRNELEKKFKSQDTFFVGISPECQIAMGTILLIESLSGLLTETNREVEINGHIYDLILIRETPKSKEKHTGMRIRSFYSKYKGSVDILNI